MKIQPFLQFIAARERVRLRKESGAPKPWTDDPILQRYRFCNIRREDDRTTRWIAQHWRAGRADNQDLWFWMLVARYINRISTLKRFTPVRAWNPSAVRTILRSVAEDGPVWGAAYMIGTHGVAKNKIDYVVDDILSSAWARRKEIRPRLGDTLAEFCVRLTSLDGVSGFTAGQVIADTKYANCTLQTADDWYTFAVSGPGSRRGLNRLLDRPVGAPWKETEWKRQLDALYATVRERGPQYGLPPLHAQDIQNCLCEFDKYERVRLGEGTPKQRYPGGAE